MQLKIGKQTLRLLLLRTVCFSQDFHELIACGTINWMAIGYYTENSEQFFSNNDLGKQRFVQQFSWPVHFGNGFKICTWPSLPEGQETQVLSQKAPATCQETESSLNSLSRCAVCSRHLKHFTNYCKLLLSFVDLVMITIPTLEEGNIDLTNLINHMEILPPQPRGAPGLD